MNNVNICKFISDNPKLNLHILHLVYETQPQQFDKWKTISFFRMHYVTEGQAILYTQNGEYKLSYGDVFFCLPSTPYAIQTIDNFRYIYVGYLGERANQTADKYNISVNNCVFHGHEDLYNMWQTGLTMADQLSALYAEGIFSCTMASIASKTIAEEEKKNHQNISALIKKCIDENFAELDFSLKHISEKLSYSTKYISKIFKEEFKISFKDYLNTIRINNACSLMSKGFCSIKDVAFLCGYNDPLYFSRVFKERMGLAPTEFIREQKQQS